MKVKLKQRKLNDPPNRIVLSLRFKPRSENAEVIELVIEKPSGLGQCDDIRT